MIIKCNYLKKSIAGAIVLATMLNGCINTNANETNNNKSSNVKKCLKYVMSAGLLGTTFIGGFILGNIKYKENSIKMYENNDNNKRAKYLKLLEYVENDPIIIDTPSLINYVSEYLDNDLGDLIDTTNITGNRISFQDFCDDLYIHKKFMINQLKKGKIYEFEGNILTNNGNHAVSMRNFLFLTILQKLFPKQVIIKRGQNEMIRSEFQNKMIPTTLGCFMVNNGICSQKAVDNIEKFFDRNDHAHS